MKSLLAALITTLALAGCVNSEEQSVRDAGYMLRMNEIACHFAATELSKVSMWLDQIIKANPKLAKYVKKGATEADDVYARHGRESDSERLNASECQKIRELAQKWVAPQ